MKKLILQNYIWFLFLIFVSAGSFVAEHINHRFSMPDLEVYEKAATRLINGEELYRTTEEDPYEHYVFKYAPPAALIFIPFALPDPEASKYLYWIFLTFIMGHLLYLSKNIFTVDGHNRSRTTLSIVLLIIIAGTHFFRELHLGQVNLLLLWCYMLAMFALYRNQQILGGIPLGISIFVKPFALIFLPFLLLSGKFRASLSFLATAMVMFLIPFVFYPDLQQYMGLYGSWMEELSIELSNKQDLLAAGNHTLFSLIARFTPLRLLPLEGSAKLFYQGLLLVLIGIFLLRFMLKDKSQFGRIKIFIVLIALIPMLAVTSYNAFILSLPLLACIIFQFRKLTFAMKVLFIISCLMIGGNIYDISGPQLFDILWGISVYTWGSMGLMIILFTEWKKIRLDLEESMQLS